MRQPPPGYCTQSADTSYEAELFLIEAWRQMSPAEKVRRIREDSMACEELALVGLRRRHPHATERELQLRLGALRLGRETMIAAFGWDPDAPEGGYWMDPPSGAGEGVTAPRT